MANFWGKIWLAMCHRLRVSFGILMLGVVFFASNAHAAGYVCNRVYTSCRAGYYLSSGDCVTCPTGCSCAGGTASYVCTVDVSFNLNGGSGTAPSTVACIVGGTCNVINNDNRTGNTTGFYRAGYVFAGWFDTSAASGGNQLTSNSVTTSVAKTYYARWTACAKGTYKTGSGTKASAACTEASNGYYVATTGQSTQAQCPSGYRSGSDSGRDAITDCYVNTTAGKYIKTANDTTQTDCPTGSFCPSAKVYYNSTGSITACPTLTTNCYGGYLTRTATNATTWGTATNNLTAKAGYKVSGSGNSATCSACGSGYYSANGATSCTACTTTSGWTTATDTTTSTAYTACYQTQTPANCASGTIKRTASSISGTTITYGTATVTSPLSSNPGYYVNDIACSPCTSGTFYGGGTATSCTSCPSGWTKSTANATANTACYKDVTLNKNGYSGSITAGGTSGTCTWTASTGTGSSTLSVWYNKECTLPTISGFTQTGYTNSSAWSSANTVAATAITKINASTTIFYP